MFRTALAKVNHRRIIRLGKLNLSWSRTNSNRSKLDSNRISIELNGGKPCTIHAPISKLIVSSNKDSKFASGLSQIKKTEGKNFLLSRHFIAK